MSHQAQRIFIPNETAMLDLGGTLAAESGSMIFLKGDLGSGKTTLTRGFLQALGHQGIVKSPTYTLVEYYHLNGQAVFHFDLYRLNRPQELDDIGFRDYFDDGSICLIEWPEKAGNMLGKPDLTIEIQFKKQGGIIGRQVLLSR